MKIETHKAQFDKPIYLESGRILESFELVYETYGHLNEDKSNVIIITHALSGSHHAAGRYSDEAKAGWWDDLIGKGKGIDTDRYFVICINNLGSSFGSTSPMSPMPNSKEPYRLRFPVIAISDIVKASMILLNSIGITEVEAVIGGSMGGMQALCYAIEYPDFAKKIIPIATTAQTRPWTIAFNKIAIEAIRNDPAFKEGHYEKDDIKANGLAGLAIGRMAGHISYLSKDSMAKKFGRNYARTDGLYELFGRYEVERYLEYNAYNFPKNFDPLSYLYIVKTINIFDVARGYDSIEESLANIRSKLHLISFSTDLLFFPEEMRDIYDVMCKIGKKEICTYKEIESTYGHDAFLVEVDKFDTYIKNILENE
jgi:homoserine O-acetyltransferase